VLAGSAAGVIQGDHQFFNDDKQKVEEEKQKQTQHTQQKQPTKEHTTHSKE
jgi:hypothetical protein